MAFGKSSGPLASHQQMKELVELLQRAGHEDFRDARGPMGFTQRQAGGKFTRDEAQAFIDRLQEAEDEALAQGEAADEDEDEDKVAPQQDAAPERAEAFKVAMPPDAENALREFSSEELAAELRRRGWFVGDD